MNGTTAPPDEHLSRRTFFGRTATAGVGAGLGAGALGALVSACGSSSPTSTKAAAPEFSSEGATGFTPSAGTDIPASTMTVALNPFPDNSFYVIGMRQGWFAELGIGIKPAPYGIKAVPSQSVSYLVNQQADMCPMTASNIVTNLIQVPQLRLLGFTDTFLGTYLLISPSLKLPTLSDALKHGVPFTQAIKQVMSKTVGKRIAFESSGQQRPFLNLIFNQLGGVQYSQIKLTVTQDPKIVDLAAGGQLDFACCNSAAQVVELIDDGWKPYVSISDLAKELPPGDPRIASNLGAPGPTVLADYWEKNQEACLRFMSVTWRIIDAVNNSPTSVLGIQTPYLTAVNGATITVPALEGIYKVINPLIGFDEQSQYLQAKSPYYWHTVIGAMLDQAQQGGVLPKDRSFNLSTQVIAPHVYAIMSELKTKYEALAPKASGKLGAQAKVFYAHRNYLDAYRFATAAVA
jgi:hypothetical protein